MSLRWWSPVGEWHRDFDSVGRWLSKDWLEGLSQDLEGQRAGPRDAVCRLQGWTLVHCRWRWRCGEAADQNKDTDAERRTWGYTFFFSNPSCATPLTCSVSYKTDFEFFKAKKIKWMVQGRWSSFLLERSNKDMLVRVWAFQMHTLAQN